jgi:hypothetical protein
MGGGFGFESEREWTCGDVIPHVVLPEKVFEAVRGERGLPEEDAEAKRAIEARIVAATTASPRPASLSPPRCQGAA